MCVSMKHQLHRQFNGNTHFGLSKGVSVIPSVLFMKQGAVTNITSGIAVRKLLKEEAKYTGHETGAVVTLGTYYRVGDARIPYWQIQMSNFSLGVSYDINVAGLSNVTSGKGGIEISLSWVAGKVDK